MAALVPMGRQSASNEMVNAALFLASDESSYIRGPSTWSMVARPRPEVARYQPFAGAADCVTSRSSSSDRVRPIGSP